MDMSWVDACNAALAKDPDTLVNEAYAFAGILIAASSLCAAASGVMFVKWRMLLPENRLRVWNLYGCFTALICGGSVALIVSVAAWMGFLVNFYPADYRAPGKKPVTPGLESTAADISMARALRWLIAFAVTAPLSLVCLVVAKLLVIQRFANFLDPKMQLTKPRLVLFGRVVVGLVVVGSIVGFSCNLAASVYFAKSSALYDAAAQNAFAASYNRTILSAAAALSEGVDFSAGFFGLEAFMLILIVVILFTVGALGARSIRSALIAIQNHVPASTRMLTSKAHSPDAATSKHLQHAVDVSRRLQRQVVGTVGVVFVSFLLRSAYSIMFAVANGFQDSDVSCQNYVGRCSNCYNSFTHMQIWMLNTPSFQLTIMLISQPVALVVALWGMTSGHTLEVMRSQCAQSNEISL